MSKALEGEHYCKDHQGNHSHYAEHNCTVCKLRAELAAANERADREKKRADVFQTAIEGMEIIGHVNSSGEITYWTHNGEDADLCLKPEIKEV